MELESGRLNKRYKLTGSRVLDVSPLIPVLRNASANLGAPVLRSILVDFYTSMRFSKEAIVNSILVKR